MRTRKENDMKYSIDNSALGAITYEEDFFTGKKKLTVNGIPLVRKKKETYIFNDGTGEREAELRGNYLLGVKLKVGGEVVQVVPALRWYETLCSILIFATIVIWGNVDVLCLIFPLAGGFVGGFVSASAAVLCALVMKAVKDVRIKLVLWLVIFAATVLVCFGLAWMILSIFYI